MDPATVLAMIHAKSRDNARTPMQWDASPHAGFTSGEPWMAVNPNHRLINAAAARADPDSVFHWHRRLIELRASEPVVVDGDFELLLPDDEQVFAFKRRSGTVELLVVANCSGRPAAAAIDDADGWAGSELLLASAASGAPTTGPFELEPWEVRVLRRVRPAPAPTGRR
jgi:oligo-1,6-glucosidase